MKADWPAVLQKALLAAAKDKGVEDFLKTLQRMVAALKDGHGNVMSAGSRQPMQPPLTFDWVGGQFLVTRVHAGKSEGVTVGDRVLKIDRKPIAQATAEVRELISGATEQWIRFRSIAALAACNAGTKRMTLELEPFPTPGESKTVQLDCMPPKYRVMEAYTEPRPDKITELEPGILYVDLDRLTDADFTALMPRLEQAKGVIFDMRG